MDAYKIGIGIVMESNGLDCKSPQQCCLADPVHAIHYATGGGENNGKLQVCGLNQAGMLRYRSACWRIAKTEPKWLVKLPDGAQWNLKTRKSFGQCNEAINVPRQKAALSLTKMILLSHLQ